MRKLLLLLVLFTSLAATPEKVFLHLQTVESPAPSEPNLFGSSMAYSDPFVAVGSPGFALGMPEAGSVAVYNRNTSSLCNVLYKPFAQPYERFGYDLLIDGSTLVVSAPSASLPQAPFAGAVYLFDLATGALNRTIPNPQPATGDLFGISLALSGSDLYVGCSGADGLAMNEGRVYAFNIASGELRLSMANPRPEPDAAFGTDISAAGNSLLVGAPGAQPAGGGSAFLLSTSQGTLLQSYHHPLPFPGQRFGESVALTASVALIGCPGASIDGFVEAGVVFAYSRPSARMRGILRNPNPSDNARFGQCVAFLSNSYYLLSAAGEAVGGVEGAGSVHVFTDSGSWVRSLTASAPKAGARFGQSLHCSGSTFGAGAPGGLGGSLEIFALETNSGCSKRTSSRTP